MDRMKQLPKERVLREWQSLHGPFFLFLTYYIISHNFTSLHWRFFGDWLFDLPGAGHLWPSRLWPMQGLRNMFPMLRIGQMLTNAKSRAKQQLLLRLIFDNITVEFFHYFSYNGWFQQAKTLYKTDCCETVWPVGEPFSMRCSLCMFLLASTALRCCSGREGSELSVHCWKQRCRKDWPARSRSRPRPDVVAVDTGASDMRTSHVWRQKMSAKTNGFEKLPNYPLKMPKF